MKKPWSIWIALILLTALLTTGCGKKEQPLRGVTNTKNMINQLSWGNITDAWDPVYRDMADPALGEKLEQYADLIAGRAVVRCDCYDFSRTGDPTGSERYEETTLYQILLEDETVLYAKSVTIQDENGVGVVLLEITEEAPAE